MGENGYEKAISEWSWEAITEQVYDNIQKAKTNK